MPTFRPLRLKTSKRGLNQHDRPEDLAPGEATVANNVIFSHDTIKKRPGHRNLLTGSTDNVLAGGVPSQSLYTVGEEYLLEHLSGLTVCSSSTGSSMSGPSSRREFYNARQGVIIIPEDDLSGMRLNCRSSDYDWAVEFPIWTDDLPLLRFNALTFTTPDEAHAIIVAAKGRSTSNSYTTSTQWAVRIIPDTTSTERFHIVLTLYEGSLHTAGTDFYYQSGANRSWVEPGRRIWVGWKFSASGATITSYYWIEGASSVVSSTASVTGTLRTNGVGGSTYPICIGKRLTNANNYGGGTTIREMGFNGCVSDFRFWDNSGGGALSLPANWGSVSASPPATTDWYVEREITEDQLTTDAAVESGNIVQSNSLRAYWQFKPELIGVSAAGSATAADKYRMIRPRYRSSGATTPVAWLTGADATWVAGSGALGSYALSLTPTGPSGQTYIYADAITNLNTAGAIYGYRPYRGGVRIPNGNAYLNRVTTASGTYEFPTALSVRVALNLGALAPNDGRTLSSATYEQTIWELAVARQGTATNYDRYAITPVMQLSIVYNSGWKFRWKVLDGSGSATSIYSTTAPAEGSTYVVCGTARWFGSNGRKLSIYVNGAQEATSTATGTKPIVSQATRTDATAPNKDDDDGRTDCFPMSVGYTNTTTEASTATPPDPWGFRFGCHYSGGIAKGQYSEHGYWAFHDNECKKDANSGVAYRGNSPFVGSIGSLQIWRDHELNESEARRFADRAPNSQEIAGYGSRLASSWDMEEGQGTAVYDRGYLKNHLLINPFPTVKVQAGAFQRDRKAPLLGLTQRRERQVRSGVPVREVYAVGGGCVHKMQVDGNGNNYLAPIGRLQTPQLYDPANVALELPTWFSFSDQLYLCTGLGPVKRITNGKLLDAGLNPVYGDIGQDQTNLGWREFDRDGTFMLLGVDAFSSATQVFVENGKYGYQITFYDPESGIESAPSRAMYVTAVNNGLSAGNGWLGIQLTNLPKPPQKNVTKYRVYRTAKDNTEFKFLAEIDVAPTWYDTAADTALGSAIDAGLNFPPPQNARIGISFGARAIYAGVRETPNTIYYSLQGQPGAVPPQYQLTFPEQITALLPYNDRVLVGTLNRWYALFDTGGDISITGIDAPPIQYAVITEETGCISHHSCVMVPEVGWIFAGSKGLYATNGQAFKYLSKKVEPYWGTLNFNAASRFVGMLNQGDNQYVLYHGLAADSEARNSKALVYHYDSGSFAIFDNTNVLNAARIEDEDTGIDRMVVTDYFGNLWEYAPPDTTVNADGVSAAPYTGTVISAKKDPLATGKYTRLRLSNTANLPTAGSGLRGVSLYVANGASPWNTAACRILWNDASYVTVESTNATTSDPTGFSWKLGSYLATWTTGKMDLGAPTLLKKAAKAQLEYGAAGGTTLGFSYQWDEQTAQEFTALSPARRFDTVAPILGRGRNCQISVYDSTATGGETNNPWEVREMEWDYFVKGRATFIGS